MNALKAYFDAPPTDGSALKTLNRLLIIALIAVMVVHFLTLTHYPLVFVDEGWLANTSWTWLTTGVNFDSIHKGVLDQFGYEWLSNYFVGELPYVAVYSVLGLGVFQTRLVAFVFSIIVLVALLMAARRRYGLTIGLAAALLLALSPPFLQASRWRQDMMLTAFIMVSFWLALVALEENKLWAHFAAGFLLGVGIDIHEVVVMFIPALAAMYLVHYGRQVFFKRGAWITGIGGALGLGIVLAYRILPSPEVYSKLMSFYFAPGAQTQFPLTNLSELLSSFIREFGRYGFRNNPLALLLIAASALFLLLRRSKMDQLVLTFTGVSFIALVLLSGDKTNLYAIHLYTFFMLIAAAAFVSVLRHPTLPRLVRVGSIAAMVAFVSLSAFTLARSLFDARDYDYYTVTNQIRAVIPAGSRIMGMPTWWIGLADYDYLSSLSLTYYHFYNDYDPAEALAVMRPDYIIFDEAQEVVLVEEGEILPSGLNAFAVPRDAFMRVIDARGQQALEFIDPRHGLFRVYAMDWNR